MLVNSSQFLRGDEANLLEPVDGFATVDLSAGYALGRGLRLSARLTNLFDTGFETFGLLGEADDVLGDDYDDPRFLSPGAPRAAWVGVEWTLPVAGFGLQASGFRAPGSRPLFAGFRMPSAGIDSRASRQNPSTPREA